MRIDIAYPLHTDAAGRTATAGYAEHIDQMVEQLVLTTPGERPMRPSYGGGAGRLLFAPISEALVSTLRFQLTTSLTQELGDLIEIRQIDVSAEGADQGVLRIDVAYLVFDAGVVQTTEVRIGGGA